MELHVRRAGFNVVRVASRLDRAGSRAVVNHGLYVRRAPTYAVGMASRLDQADLPRSGNGGKLEEDGMSFKGRLSGPFFEKEEC